MADYEEYRERLEQLLLDADEEALNVVSALVPEKLGVLVFLKEIYQPVMAEIGDKFSRMEIFLPELVEASELAGEISEKVLQPLLLKEESGSSRSCGKVLIGTAFGDMHDIGKNMVAFMLRVNDFEVVDLGVNVAPKKFLDAAKEQNADILAISALMSTSLPYIKETIEMREGFGMKNQFPIMIGGASVTPEYCARVGADAYGMDAMEAVRLCKDWMQKKKAGEKGVEPS